MTPNMPRHLFSKPFSKHFDFFWVKFDIMSYMVTITPNKVFFVHLQGSTDLENMEKVKEKNCGQGKVREFSFLSKSQEIKTKNSDCHKNGLLFLSIIDND